MNLRNNQITLGELLENPHAKAVLQKRFGEWLSHPMLSMAKNMTLQQIIDLAGNQLSPAVVSQTLLELRHIT